MLQNLLQTKQKKDLEIEYYVRLVTVAALMLAGVVGIGAIALLPAYARVFGERTVSENTYEAQKKNIEDTKMLADEVSHSELMLTFLEENASQEKLTTLLSEVFKERPTGIVISGFSYNKNSASLMIQGVAATRDLVVPYAQAIEANPYFEKAPVPISDLAKNTDLDFHLSIVLAKQVKK